MPDEGRTPTPCEPCRGTGLFRARNEPPDDCLTCGGTGWAGREATEGWTPCTCGRYRLPVAVLGTMCEDGRVHRQREACGREATHAKVCRWIKGQQVEYDTQACIRCRQMESPPARGTS